MPNESYSLEKIINEIFFTWHQIRSNFGGLFFSTLNTKLEHTKYWVGEFHFYSVVILINKEK